MSLQIDMTKYILKSLPIERADKQSCLSFLMTALTALPSRELIRQLAQIGKMLDQDHDILEVHDKLVKEYASPEMKNELILDPGFDGVVLLFNRFALKLINELLRINTPHLSTFLVDKIPKWALSIEGLFLSANSLVVIIENEPLCTASEDSEHARIFFSRFTINKSVAIGRSEMYRYAGFTSMLKKLDIEIEDYLQAVLSLSLHFEKRPLMELELPASLRQMSPNAEQVLQKYLPYLSGKEKSKDWNLTAIDALSKLYYTDALCRQHPLIQVDGRYYCLEPGLLWAALADLPFYLLLDSCKKDNKKTRALWKTWGDSFEDHWRGLGQRIFGIDKCTDYHCQKTYPTRNLIHKNHRIGDLLVTLNSTARVIFEFKGAAPDDSIKLGNRSKARLKFIQHDGICQLVRDSDIYRQETLFDGTIFIILVCRGPFPPTYDFDIDVKNYLEGLADYQDYLTNTQNRPVIWLDALSAELLFSGLKQGLSVEDTLQCLAGVPPSKIRRIISEKIQQYGLNFSLSHLYTEEIESQLQLGRSMFCDPCEIFK